MGAGCTMVCEACHARANVGYGSWGHSGACWPAGHAFRRRHAGHAVETIRDENVCRERGYTLEYEQLTAEAGDPYVTEADEAAYEASGCVHAAMERAGTTDAADPFHRPLCADFDGEADDFRSTRAQVDAWAAALPPRVPS